VEIGLSTKQQERRIEAAEMRFLRAVKGDEWKQLKCDY
jgi:hypothetical protein